MFGIEHKLVTYPNIFKVNEQGYNSVNKLKN